MPVDPTTFNGVTHAIIGAAIEVHRTIGPGLLECLTKCPAGLLINFNVPKLMDGVRRLINPKAA